MSETPAKPENNPIATQTRVPPEEYEDDENEERNRPIATRTRVP